MYLMKAYKVDRTHVTSKRRREGKVSAIGRHFSRRRCLPGVALCTRMPFLYYVVLPAETRPFSCIVPSCLQDRGHFLYCAVLLAGSWPFSVLCSPACRIVAIVLYCVVLLADLRQLSCRLVRSTPSFFIIVQLASWSITASFPVAL